MSSSFDITSESYSRFTFERDGRVLTAAITSDHPVNGVDAAMHEELGRVFTDLQRDTDSDIIILTGKGRAFCAGGDFDWFDEQISDPRNFRDIAWEAKRIVSSLLEMEKPIICRLNGAAAGLGATIALLCDMVVADESAVIGDPHVKAGLVAGDGGALIWPQLIGYVRAKELLLTGDISRKVERLLVQEGSNVDVDVLLVPHHGSKTSSRSSFIDATSPRWALVSAGYKNRYRHPHPDVVARYQNAGVELLQSAVLGAVALRYADGLWEGPFCARYTPRHYWQNVDNTGVCEGAL